MKRFHDPQVKNTTLSCARMRAQSFHRLRTLFVLLQIQAQTDVIFLLPSRIYCHFLIICIAYTTTCIIFTLKYNLLNNKKFLIDLPSKLEG